MEISALREAGLTDGETKIYLALLELGSSTTGPIIEKSKVARSIAPQILNKLIEKGLASYIVKEKTKYYQASQPNKIIDYIDERKNFLEDTKDQVIDLLPLLISKQQGSPKSKAQIYEGFKGIQTVHEKLYTVLKKGDEFYYLGIPEFQEEKYHIYWNKDHLKRVKAGIKCRLLFNKDTPREVLKNRNSYALCDSRYMHIDIKTPAWFFGYKDVIVIGLQSKEIAIEIKDQDIADSFYAYFEEFWKHTKRFN
jgi:sugar-specific transcriptional regulator TrmB